MHGIINLKVTSWLNSVLSRFYNKKQISGSDNGIKRYLENNKVMHIQWPTEEIQSLLSNFMINYFWTKQKYSATAAQI